MELELVINLRALLVLVSLILSFFVIYYVLTKGRRHKLTFIFLIFQATACMWALFELFEVYTYDTKTKWIVTQIKFLPISFVGVIWLVFSLYYVEHRILKYKHFMRLLFLPPAVFYAFCLTNTWHYFYFDVFTYNVTGFGVVFWLHTVESYIYILIGITILLKSYLSVKNGIRHISFVLATLVPMIINVLHVLKVIDTPFDATPLFFPFSLTIFVIITFRLKFLNLMPFAFERIYEKLDEGVIVVDTDNKIVSFNNTFSNYFSHYLSFTAGMSLEDFIEKLRKHVSNDPLSINILRNLGLPMGKLFTGELNLDYPKKRIFKIKVRKIFDKRGQLIGRCILFNDISEYKKLLEEVERKNSELMDYNNKLSVMNDKLNEQIDMLEELTLYKERTRIAREVHDTVGHTLTLIIMLVKTSKAYIEEGRSDVLEKLDQVISLAQKGFNEVRTSIKGLTFETDKKKDMIFELKRLIEHLSYVNVRIKLSVMGDEYYKKIIRNSSSEKFIEVISKVCREAITNSVRHGKAKEIDIIFKFSDNIIKLYIIDNGLGCQELIKGFGLSGIEARVKSVDGKVTFGSSGEGGFNIHIELPVVEEFK